MEWSVILALLGAALLHASWHALIKNSGDPLIGLAGMNMFSTSVALVVLPFVTVPEGGVWMILALSVLLHNGYKLGLARLYRHAELSQAYPLARGFCPILATVIAFFALGESPTAYQLFGIVLISGGILAMRLDEADARPGMSLLFIVFVTGLMVAAYTVLDAYGARLSGDWLSFLVWLMFLDGLAFVGLISLLRGGTLWTTVCREWRLTLISGFLGVTAFSVFLWALSRGLTGGVSALRETSVLFASLIGILIYKERYSLRKLAGIVCITAGIITFALRV
ncbi:MAG: DMT family transporter [Burkholderiales bacterium]|nr:DMT family transporter [Burkholderiales bacterium]